MSTHATAPSFYGARQQRRALEQDARKADERTYTANLPWNRKQRPHTSHRPRMRMARESGNVATALLACCGLFAAGMRRMRRHQNR